MVLHAFESASLTNFPRFVFGLAHSVFQRVMLRVTGRARD